MKTCIHSSRWLIITLMFSLAGLMACGQDPSGRMEGKDPTSEPVPTGAIPPPVRDSLDRSDWVVKDFGTRPIRIAVPQPLVATGDQVPENARQYVLRNETFSGVHGDDLQIIVNAIEYAANVPVDLDAIASSAEDQMRSDVANARFESRRSSLSVSGYPAIRQDASLFRDGMIHYWCNVLISRGQEVFQVMTIYPETYALGQGDVEAMMASLSLPK